MYNIERVLHYLSKLHKFCRTQARKPLIYIGVLHSYINPVNIAGFLNNTRKAEIFSHDPFNMRNSCNYDRTSE